MTWGVEMVFAVGREKKMEESEININLRRSFIS